MSCVFSHSMSSGTLLSLLEKEITWITQGSKYSCSLYSLETELIKKHRFQQLSIMVSCVRCCGNVFISCSLGMAISSGSTILVFQLPYHNMNIIKNYPKIKNRHQGVRNSKQHTMRLSSIRSTTAKCQWVCEHSPYSCSSVLLGLQPFIWWWVPMLGPLLAGNQTK
jgi:hypothetical protein